MKSATLIRQLAILVTVGLLLSLVGYAYALEGGTLGSADAQFIGEAAGDQAGYRAVAGAGDVNGDGFDDVLFGAYSNDQGGSDAGAAYLVLGCAGGRGLYTSLAHPSVIKFVGESAGDNAGYSVSGTGDVNGDGFDDMLIGAAANGVGGSFAGAVYLVLGNSAPNGGDLDGSGGDTIIRFIGEASWDRAGVSVAGAGDVNGDGYDDMLVGAVGSSGGASTAGAAYLILGNATLNGGSLNGSGGDSIYRYTGESFLDAAGTRVSGAGDVNGDGYADMLVGASGDDDSGSDAGAAYLVMGGASPASGSLAGGSGNTIFKYTGESVDDYAGIGASGAGDVNGDGYDDILIGAEGNDSGGTNSGAAYLVLGSANPPSGGLAGAIRYSGESGWDSAGFAVAGVGDVNGDDYSDMLIGADRNDGSGSNAGAVFLILGSPLPQGGSLGGSGGDTIYRYTGESGSDHAGGSVGGAGDVNGDGYSDILVGAEDHDSGGADAGAAYLILSDYLSPGASPIRQRHRLRGGATRCPSLLTKLTWLLTLLLVHRMWARLLSSDIFIIRVIPACGCRCPYGGLTAARLTPHRAPHSIFGLNIPMTRSRAW